MFIPHVRTYALGIILATTLLVGTSFAQQKPSTVNANLWPLKKGNSWTLATKVVDSVTKKTNRMDQVFTVTNVQKTPDGDVATVEDSVNGKPIQIEKYTVNSLGVRRTAGGQDGKSTLTPPLPLIKYPFKVGSAWSWTGIINTPVGNLTAKANYSVPAVQTLKLAGQTFQAYQVHLVFSITQGSQTGATMNDYWFAPNIGLVKQRAVIGTSDLECLLSKYTLVK